MNPRRACITSLGRHVPERVMTNADLAKIVDTSDEWIRTRTGIEAAARGGEGHGHQRDRRPRRARVPGAGGGGGRGGGPHHRGHRDPGHALPRHRLPRAGPDQGHEGLGLRHQRRLLGLPLRPHRGRAVRGDGGGAQGAGDRGRRDDGHPRLLGSLHLRALRRRRGSGAPGAAARTERASWTSCTRWTASGGRPALHVGGGQPPPRHPRDGGQEDALHPPGGPGGLQVRGAQVRRGQREPPRAQPRDARASSTSSSPTRPTCASSTPPATGWACPTRRW